jgi:hypothetical protein
MLKVVVFVFLSLPRELVSNLVLDYKDPMNPTRCES